MVLKTQMKTLYIFGLILSLLYLTCSDTVNKVTVNSIGNNTTAASLVIDEYMCTKCDKCISACPRYGKALSKIVVYEDQTVYVIDPSQCLRCGLCIDRCHFGAIIWKH